jgi:hypothetical protein
MNLVEVFLQMTAVLLHLGGAGAAPVLALVCSVMTASKTALYFLTDYLGTPGKKRIFFPFLFFVFSILAIDFFFGFV